MRPTSEPIGVSAFPSAASILSSVESGSLWPPREKNLIPLSGAELWLAEIITPKSASRSAVRYAAPGVGITPASKTSTPDEAKPAETAAERKSLEILGSWPITALGRSPRERASSERTKAAACAKRSAKSAVMSLLAMPRTPSVPNSLPMAEAYSLALGELASLAGLLQTSLLALDDTSVAA